MFAVVFLSLSKLHLLAELQTKLKCAVRLSLNAPSHFVLTIPPLLAAAFRYSYMIDNVILLITGTLHQRAISELVPKCHPLGSFEQMEAVNIAQTPAELYNAILVDTPLGRNGHF